MKRMLATAVCAAALLAGCNNNDAASEATPDQAAEPLATGTVAARATPVALGLSEGQLIGADLLGIDGIELGEVEALLRAPDGRVDRLLVEVEDSDPDRFVEVPIQGLTILTRGRDIDLVSTLTVAQLAAMPEGTRPAD